MTATDTPEPDDENEARRQAMLKAFLDNPEIGESLQKSLRVMRNSMRAWNNDQVIQNAVAVLGKPTALRGDPEKIPDAEVPAALAEQLDNSREVGHVLDNEAKASEKRAQRSFRVAVASAVIAALALVGALPQGIAAIPQMVAVFNGSAWEEPPAVMVPALPSGEPPSSPSPPPSAEATE